MIVELPVLLLLLLAAADDADDVNVMTVVGCEAGGDVEELLFVLLVQAGRSSSEYGR